MGNLGDDGGQSVIFGGDAQHVPGPERRTPRGHMARVDTVKFPGESKCRPPVVLLAADVEHPTWLAGTVTPAPVVEYQDGEAGFGEALGVSGKTQGAHRGEAVGHHDDRRPLDAARSVEPGGARRSAGFEGRVFSGVGARFDDQLLTVGCVFPVLRVNGGEARGAQNSPR